MNWTMRDSRHRSKRGSTSSSATLGRSLTGPFTALFIVFGSISSKQSIRSRIREHVNCGFEWTNGIEHHWSRSIRGWLVNSKPSKCEAFLWDYEAMPYSRCLKPAVRLEQVRAKLDCRCRKPPRRQDEWTSRSGGRTCFRCCDLD